MVNRLDRALILTRSVTRVGRTYTRTHVSAMTRCVPLLVLLLLIAVRQTGQFDLCSSFLVLESDHEEMCDLDKLHDPDDENEDHEFPNIIGDVLPEYETEEDEDFIGKRKVVSFVSKIWPGGIVPYKFVTGKRKFKKRKSLYYIRIAMRHWERYTCIQFVDIVKQRQRYMTLKKIINHDHYLLLGTGPGCASMVGFAGRRRRRAQPMYLKETGCTKPGIVVHELGHAIGFYHEQCREDRDNFVQIHIHLVKEPGRKNFNKVNTHTDIAPYDLGSTMHYGPKYFSINGSCVLTTRDPNLNFLLGRRSGLSFYDAVAANVAYRCTAKCSPTSSPKCQNGGVLFKNCQCLCPEGLGGDVCQQVDHSWTKSGCGGVVNLTTDKEVIISSPKFPYSYGKARCIWLIKSPTGSQIRTSVVLKRIPRSRKRQRCYHWLEIRYNLIGQNGPRICGSSAKKEFPLSSENRVMLRFSGAKGHVKTSGGFQVRLQAVRGDIMTGATCGAGDAHSSGTPDLAFGFCEAMNQGDRLFYCDFDTSLCGMMDTRPGSKLHWKREQWVKNGPYKDHTSGKGSFVAEADSKKIIGSIARMCSPLLQHDGESCVRFWYFAYGYHLGHFRIICLTDDGQETEIWTLDTSEKSRTWKQGHGHLNAAGKFKVILEVTASAKWGNYAIDDLEITIGKC